MTDKMFTRGIAIPAHRPKSFDDSRNSVRVVAVTENPVRVWDWERKSSIDEILLIDGAHLPPSGQIPLLDSHNRSSVTNVLGSARNFAPNGNILECDVFFSGTETGKNAALNVKEGHLTDFSVGYFPAESEYIPAGEVKNINGRQFKGPVKVTTRWNLRELSLTPIGADENATARSQDVITPSLPFEEPPSPVQSSGQVKETELIQPVAPETEPASRSEKQAEVKLEDISVALEPLKEDARPALPGSLPGPENQDTVSDAVRQDTPPPPPPVQEPQAQHINIIDMFFYVFIGIMVFFLLKGLFY
ncbi:Uncharacterized protein dnl_55300 [Desulfonema limicola]|uniref:Uncharacterized protein n=1 Tax=Desulfonema limicola TaxID=45656 RepID=A0A975BD27_9BACT|nr:hypothetical protein [Desulfonema limicola]QTA83136.1 Uncharacterized protein dnl_55300 [Desulfonema limicola]